MRLRVIHEKARKIRVLYEIFNSINEISMKVIFFHQIMVAVPCVVVVLRVVVVFCVVAVLLVVVVK